MPDVDDIALLREYVDRNSEPAFAGIVRRHINLVYSVALRFTNNSEDARDVTQAVFIILAKKAAGLRPKTILTGWLYETTRFAALNFLTNRNRRQAREQEAYMQSNLNEAETEPLEPLWQQLRPLLENAMSRLNERDRMLVALRFFENRSIAETAAVLGINEWAARKRADRALEKLRAHFSKSGVHCPADSLAGALCANSLQAAPIGLAQAISAVAVAKGAAASTSTLTFVKGALKLMAWSKTKTAIAGAAIALLGIGATTVVVNALLPVPDIQGTWECVFTIPAPGMGVYRGQSPQTHFVLRITKASGGYQTSIDDIDRGHKDGGFDTFTYRYPYVRGEVAPGQITPTGLSFVAKVDRSGESMSWKLREGTNAYAMVFNRTTNPPPFPEPLDDADFVPRVGSTLQGFWLGTIGRGNGAVHFQIKIAEASDGTFRGDFYVPEQGGERQPTAVSYDGTTVRLTTMANYGMFEGQLRNGNSEMTGNWIQGGRYTPTTLAQTNYSPDMVQAVK